MHPNPALTITNPVLQERRQTVFRKSLIPLALLCAATLLAAPRTARADVDRSVSGGGWSSGGLGETRFSFNAVQLEDGTAIGHAVFNYQDEILGAGVATRLEIDLDGIQYDGWIALTGIVKSGPLPAGTRVVFHVFPVIGSVDRLTDPLSEYYLIPAGYTLDDCVGQVVRGRIQLRWE